MTAGSPGERAGLRAYDLITAIDGKRVAFTGDALFGNNPRNDGTLRHPSFQGLREDKKAKDVVREEPH